MSATDFWSWKCSEKLFNWSRRLMFTRIRLDFIAIVDAQLVDVAEFKAW